MRRTVTMRSRLVPLVLEYVGRHGGDAAALADSFAIPAALRRATGWSMDAPAMRVDQVVGLCDQAAVDLGDPLLGLHVAQAIPRGTYGVLEFAARNAPTVREAAVRLIRHQRLINDAVEYSIADEGGATALRHTVPGRPEGVGVHGNLFTLGVLLRYLGEVGVTGPAKRIEIAHRAPRQELTGILAAEEVRFGAGHNALVYDSRRFEDGVADSDPALLPVLDRYAAELMPTEDPSAGWAARIREHLRRALAGGAPSLEEVARHFSTSPRNLQRQLRGLDTSYSRLVDGLREQEARRLVVDPGVALSEVAFLLGYSEARAFLRAFKRWTGTSPGRFRAEV